MSRTEKDPFEVGIIGAGGISEYIHAPLVDRMSDVSLSYIADIDPEQVTKLGDYGGKGIVIDDPEDLPDCDIGVLAIPVGVRVPYHEEFARRGTPVFVEKPFAINASEHDHLVSIHQTVFCDYMRTCFSTTRQVKAIVSSGIFGSLEKVSVSEQGRVGATGIDTGSYKTDPELSGGGVLIERGCHPLSQLVSIFPEHEKTVNSATVRYNDGIDAEVTAEFNFQLAEDTIPIEFEISNIHPIENRTTLAFQNAAITFDQTDPEASITVQPHHTENYQSENISKRLAKNQTPLIFEQASAWGCENLEAFYLRWRQFISSINQNGSVSSVIETAPEVTDLITEIYEQN